MTPRVLEDIKRKLEERRQQALDTQEKVSPVLQKLRDTPALKTKQRLLQQKHHAAKSNARSLCVGGGVSLWPQMDNMRLTRRETVALTAWCVGLVVAVQAIFSYLHGTCNKNMNAGSLCMGGGVSLWPQMDNMRLTRRETVVLTAWCVGLVLAVQAIFSYLHGVGSRRLFWRPRLQLALSCHVMRKLLVFTGRLRRFHGDHRLEVTRGQQQFDRSVLRWHTDYRNIMESIEQDFHVSVGGAPVLFQLSLLLYLLSICTLLYYLGDNMLSKSKLTPRRIKLWVSLLVVTGVWTLLGLKLLTTAQHLETAVETTVYQLSEELGDLVLLDHDLSRYHSVLRYWQYRCTPPTSPGVLSILGILQVRDVNYYLQYYSLPVLTALCTPVVRLVLALKQVYSPA
ncbi:uncharacterized protein LOC144925390 [Branchiostoma floridae x Branchiostoma belcheri]